MKRTALVFFAVQFLFSSRSWSEDRYFLGTRTGFGKTQEVFSTGKYKDTRLFLVIGTKPTNHALDTLFHLKSRETFLEYTKNGATEFRDQLSESAHCIPENGKKIGASIADLGRDPYKELKDPSIITPAKLIWFTVANTFKAGYYGVLFFLEPAGRVTYGTLRLTAGPFVKPAQVLGVGTAIVATGTYGYASSIAGGGVFLGATGAVAGLDLATSPLVALHQHYAGKSDQSVQAGVSGKTAQQIPGRGELIQAETGKN